jgi:uncharacterized membrane protein YdbT with pleckstrin-like domain
VSYIEDSLSAGEKIEHLFRLHWFAWVPMWIWLILGLGTLGLTWFVVAFNEFPRLWLILGLVTFGLTLIVALYDFLRLRFIEQGVTNKRVVLKKGIISRSTEEMKLTSIETVEINQGFWGRIFGFGTVKVTGKGISDVVYKGIDDPMAVKRHIESISNPAV